MASVTQELNTNRQMMGGSGSSNTAYMSSTKNLNYAKGSNSLVNARSEKISVIPYESNYQDTIGLFGAENVFLKVELNIRNSSRNLQDESATVQDYEEAALLALPENGAPVWSEVVLNENLDLTTLNTYEPALRSSEIGFVAGGVVKIDLQNLKTGNKYIDSWFDVRLYTKHRLEHPYDTMYVDVKDFFYVGSHARNTKRLPYNVRMTVGADIVSKYTLSPQEKKYLVN